MSEANRCAQAVGATIVLPEEPGRAEAAAGLQNNLEERREAWKAL